MFELPKLLMQTLQSDINSDDELPFSKLLLIAFSLCVYLFGVLCKINV